MTVLQLFNRWFYFYEDTPYRSCLCRNGEAIIRPSTDKVGSLCFSQVLLRATARGGAALIILGTIKECVS